jgi:hypothetical protein
MMHGNAAFACKMDMHDGLPVNMQHEKQHGHGRWRHRHEGWACCRDKQQGYTAWTCSSYYIIKCSMDMLFGHVFWKHGHAARIQHGHGYAA